MKLYMKVTNDEYELPLAVADTQEELAKLLGVSRTAVSKALTHQKSHVYSTSSYKEIEVDDD